MEQLRRLRSSFRSSPPKRNLPTDRGAQFRLLFDSIIHDRHKELDELLEAFNEDAGSYTFGRNNRNLLHVAASFGHCDCTQVLLKRGIPINTQDSTGVTALHLAARNGHKKCLKMLVDRGADASIVDEEGSTAVHWLAANGRAELLQYLLQLGNAVNLRDRQGQMPLHCASSAGHASAVACLLDFQAEVNVQDSTGRTPLLVACQSGQAECLKILLQHDAELTPDSSGLTPFIAAVGSRSKGCIAALILQNPRLLHDLVMLLNNPDVEDERVYRLFLEAAHIGMGACREVLNGIASVLATAGHQLLCLSTDFDLTSRQYQRATTSMKFVIEELRKNVVVNQQESIILEQIVDEVLEQLDPLWSTLDQWLDLLIAEGKEEQGSAEAATHKNSDANNASSGDPGVEDGTAEETKAAGAAAARMETLQSEQQPSNSRSCAGATAQDAAAPQPAAVGVSNGSSADLDAECVGESQPSDASQRQQQQQSYASTVPLGNDKPSQVDAAAAAVSSAGTGTTDNPLEHIAGSAGDGTAQDVSLLKQYTPRICVVVEGFKTCSTLPQGTGVAMHFMDTITHHLELFKRIVLDEPVLLFRHLQFLLDHHTLMREFRPLLWQQPFADRRQWFYEQLQQQVPFSATEAAIDQVFTVDRGRLFETSCGFFSGMDADQLKREFYIKFANEPASGAGVRREWFQVLSTEILNPDFALFVSSDGRTFQPNPNSDVNPDHLSYFRFAGALVGMAMFHQQVLDVYFSRSMYKHMLGLPLAIDDLDSYDHQFASSVRWILENDLSDLGLDLTFSVDHEVFGVTERVDLLPDGENIPVTEENKLHYCTLLSELKMTRAIRAQLASFLEGLHEFIPQSLLSMFNEYELELVISGVPDIDVDDWRANTQYSGFEETSLTVQYFWEVVQQFSQKERALLLQFSTGSSRVPLGGFRALQGFEERQSFTLSKIDGQRLPSASTCFNLLKICEYESKAELQKQLTMVLDSGSQGFDFA